jgi:hypothetical protein
LAISCVLASEGDCEGIAPAAGAAAGGADCATHADKYEPETIANSSVVRRYCMY